jgi:hypothetical protein
MSILKESAAWSTCQSDMFGEVESVPMLYSILTNPKFPASLIPK